MGFLSTSALTSACRLTIGHARPSPLLRGQSICYKTQQCLAKFPTRPASQWNRRRPSPSYRSFEPYYALWRTSPLIRLSFGALGVGGGVFYFSNLESVPVSGRRRFNFISPQREAALAKEGFEEILRLYQDQVLPPDHPYSQVVQRVVERLLPVSGVQDQNWEVRVIDDPDEKNAFVMPGGKIFVFSGILPVCDGEDGLAHVLAHEIGHTVAHHVSENLSKAAPQQILAFAIAFFFDISGGLSRYIVDIALKKTNSRTQESEADYIGLLMVAKACYDPGAGVGLWRRMAKEEEDERFITPQFLSTHPASQQRVKQLEQWLPEAENVQLSSNCSRTNSLASNFRDAVRQPRIGRAERAESDDDYWF